MDDINSRKQPRNCLRAHRKLSKYKQKEVAFLLGLENATQLSLWENSSVFPGSRNLLLLYLFYEVPIEELFPELIQQLRNELEERALMLFQQLRDKRTRDDGT